MDIPKNYVTPQEVRHKISYFKNKLIHPDEAQSKAHLVIEKTYAEIYKNYQKALFENNAVDFDDLLILPLQLFEKNLSHRYEISLKMILIVAVSI